ncbi:MAG: hypothetical protein IPM23_18615 [Candidatus Melainabacteria bacterium]|nr:hypothetical protein [Candidatus Melainabacteria bacterium]
MLARNDTAFRYDDQLFQNYQPERAQPRPETGDSSAESGTDYRALLDQLQTGFSKRFEVKEEIARTGGGAQLTEREHDQDLENWKTYERYLEPAQKSAVQAFELIGSGTAQGVKDGERLLLETLRLRPALQFNKTFQEDVRKAYRDMAANRHGQPLLDFRSELPQFDSDADPILRKRLELFRDKIALDRTIAQTAENGGDTSGLTMMRTQIADREWDAYQEFLAPSMQSARQGFELISSGNAGAGKELLLQALRQAPELEFSKDFYESTNRAFESYAQRIAGSEAGRESTERVEQPSPQSEMAPASDRAFMPPPLPEEWNRRWRERYHPTGTSPEQDTSGILPARDAGTGRDTTATTDDASTSHDANTDADTTEPGTDRNGDNDTSPGDTPQDFKPPELDDVEDFRIPEFDDAPHIDQATLKRWYEDPTMMTILGVAGFVISLKAGKYVMSRINPSRPQENGSSETRADRAESERAAAERAAAERAESERAAAERAEAERAAAERAESERAAAERAEAERAEAERPRTERREGTGQQERVTERTSEPLIEPDKVEVPVREGQPDRAEPARRPRIIGDATTFDPRVQGEQTETGVFDRRTGTGSEAISGLDRTSERLSSNEIEVLRQEIARLKGSGIEADQVKGRNLERVVGILEGSNSPRVQDAAHKYILERIREKGDIEARANGTVSRGVGAALIVSAALAFYIAYEASKEEDRQESDSGATINAR